MVLEQGKWKMSNITFSKPATIIDAMYEAQTHCIHSVLKHVRSEVQKLEKKYQENLDKTGEDGPVESEGPWGTPGEIDSLIDTIYRIQNIGRCVESKTEGEELSKFFDEAVALAEAINNMDSGKFHVHFQEILNHEKHLKIEWEMRFQINGRTIIAFSVLTRCDIRVSAHVGEAIQDVNFEFKKTWMPVT